MLDEADLRRKLKKAAQTLLLQRHRIPGVKGWELKKSLGRDYIALLSPIRDHLATLGLDLKIISEAGNQISNGSEQELDHARFYVVFRDTATAGELVSAGWRIDDLAGLAASLAYITAHHGKVLRKELEKLLNEKFPKWRAELNIERFIKRGYLSEDKEALVTIGWRTRAEVDERTLLSLILAAETGVPEASATPSPS